MSKAAQQYHAVAKNARISPRKAILSCALIRGKRVEEALNLLGFELRRGSAMMRKVLESAVANASAVGGIDPMDLVVTEARVDKGIVHKRWRPASRGRSAARWKRCSHIAISVAKQEA
ncbi:MAG: 50S ribosomal protein L22, partial [Planctomycetota bacterium]